MPLPIYKHVFQIVVLNDRREYHPGMDGDDLNVIAVDITDGDSIGQVDHLSSNVVDPDSVRAELIALGNDGTFFGSQTSTCNCEDDGEAPGCHFDDCPEYQAAPKTA